ncbi:MAG TPA: hypothetical protein VLA58_10375, partial [Chitinophagaceae bacterium]|nr:hypothetical protein [Chitinophagaceae bacterium]
MHVMIYVYSLLLVLFSSLFSHTNEGADIRHSIFIAGPDFTGILGENGEVVWDSGKPGARDGYVLQNGHVLICWSDEVREYDVSKKVIFSFRRAAPENELGTAVRLESGNTMITESGRVPRLIETDASGKVVSSVALQPETDNIHMQTRMARKISNGNYLVPHLLAFAVKEYRPDGTVVNVFKTDLQELGGRAEENWPFTAIRLENGHTLITLTHGNKIIEMDRHGEVVWKLSNQDFPEKPFADPCGAQRLPDAHTMIASYGAAKDAIKLFEVDQHKKMVWKYSGPYRVHHFQVL